MSGVSQRPLEDYLEEYLGEYLREVLYPGISERSPGIWRFVKTVERIEIPIYCTVLSKIVLPTFINSQLNDGTARANILEEELF